jgi:hypothetical protein
MITIAWKDRTGGNLNLFDPQYNSSHMTPIEYKCFPNNLKKWDRIIEGLNNLKGTGNIVIYLVKVRSNKLLKKILLKKKGY